MVKKRYLYVLALSVALVLSLCFAFGCAGRDDSVKDTPQDDVAVGDENSDGSLMKFEGITFGSAEYTYDGTEKEIVISGSLPAGAEVVYTDNSAVNAGTYSAKALVTCEGYEDLELFATLTINRAEIVGITFDGAEYTYDGTEKSIVISGSLPAGAEVVYTDNSAVNAGTYSAKALVTCENYEDLELSATLTINRAEIVGITFSGKTFILSDSYDEYRIEIEGDLPEGVTVKYTDNVAYSEGVWTATAVLTGDNYVTLTLEATLRVLDLGGIATSVVSMVMGSPDPWSFIPEGLREESMAYDTLPVTDFTSDVKVEDIGTRFIGMQLSTMYDMLGYAETAIGWIETVNNLSTQLIGLYQEYINSNPDNYREYTGSLAGFSIGIFLTDEEYLILAGNSTVSVEMYYDLVEGYNGGRVQLTGGIALKYTYTDTTLRMALELTIAGIGAVYDMEFIRSGDGSTVGYLYECYGMSALSYDTAVVIVSYPDSYTYVMSAKRESDDYSIIGYEEIYDSETGEYVGGYVQEQILTTYDTLWLNIKDVTGFDYVRVDGDGNVYVNKSDEVFETVSYGGINLKMTSRRYDIELKTVYYVVKSGDSYETVKAQIPMIFVQLEKTDDFPGDVTGANSGTFTVEVALPQDIISLLENTYDTIYETYSAVKDLESYDSIVAFIGENNPFFST